MADIPGIDASRHQGVIDWVQVALGGFTFAFLKATDGVRYDFVNWFHQNAALAQAQDCIVGAYHFLLDHHPGEAQARFYVDEVSKQFPGFVGVVPIVDIEREADGTTPRIEHLRAFVAEFKRLVPGRPILIYTGRWYWVDVIGNPFGADLGLLWHSEYDGINPIDFAVANGPELDVYGGWTECSIWQHTSSGVVPGVAGACDRNLSYVTVDALLALAGTPLTTSTLEDDLMPLPVLYVEGDTEGRAAFTVFDRPNKEIIRMVDIPNVTAIQRYNAGVTAGLYTYPPRAVDLHTFDRAALECQGTGEKLGDPPQKPYVPA